VARVMSDINYLSNDINQQLITQDDDLEMASKTMEESQKQAEDAVYQLGLAAEAKKKKNQRLLHLLVLIIFLCIFLMW
jgi:t-SNARE complex subunit (syntaxin)